MTSILYGLLSAIGWGAGDFTGGLAARKVGAYRAVFYGEVVGIFVLLFGVAISGESAPTTRDLTLALVAGAFGTIGLMCLYHAMTLGLMSIAAPVSALLAAAFPVIVSAFTEGLPDVVTLIGFGFALLAVWMISQGEASGMENLRDLLSHLSDLKLPLSAGLAFGLYFVIMHEATQYGGVFFPMVISRLGGMILIAAYLVITRSTWGVTRSSYGMIALNGVLDVSGNLFFILSGQAGRLDVASVLSSLFPGATVLLAWIFLKEQLARNQKIGVACALAAIVLITI